MDSQEFLRLIDSISRDRGLDKNLMIDEIEHALVQAATKRFDAEGEFTLTIDRDTGEIRAFEDDRPVDMSSLGRIVANVAKQVITQRLRESERDLLFDEWQGRNRTVVNGTIMRVERGMVIVGLGRTEAILPREEQIPGEIYRPGAVIRGYLITVAKKGQRVRLVMSRTHVGFVRELFNAEVPEIGDGLIEVKGLVREPGRRTKIAVHSQDPRVDPVGACVGMRGSRITKIADEIGGEKIDIIPWSEDPAQYIINSLKPASILRVSYDEFRDRASVVVSQDQLPLAIGKAGQNVRLSARLTRYKIDVCSEDQASERRAEGAVVLQPLVDAGLIDDFGREVFLDSFLNTYGVLASLSARALSEGIEDQYQLDEARAESIVQLAESKLDDDGRAEKDDLIRRRAEEEARRAAEEEAELQQSLSTESLAEGHDDDIMTP